jgi:Asp/Glu/hydantoin racemase
MQSLQTLLKEACEDAGEDFASYRNDYSGRGMYGARCVGITGTMSECQLIIAQVIKNMSMVLSTTACDATDPAVIHVTSDDLADTENEFDKAITQIMNFSQDSMGMGGVILYWEGLAPLTEADSED